ncbi:hypothetical protein [Patulibacter defluvii]|uniref:hypothetical protein n=1 Tax=Patulibacter defluvii TaxID=3095358 RepID=UPI002A74F584|nr:hypothetical protein [Patulibacter sp. DM4]
MAAIAGGVLAAAAIAAAPAAAVPNDSPGATPRWTTVGGTGLTTALAAHGDTLYLGGAFQGVGRRAAGLAVVDRDGGTLDERVAELQALPDSTAGVRIAAADGAGGAWLVTSGAASAGPSGLAHATADGRIAPSALTLRQGVATAPAATLTRIGDQLVVTGAFDSADGQPRPGVAAFDAASGALSGWRPPAVTGGQILRAVAAGDDGVLLLGSFTTVDGQPRAGAALVDRTTGNLRSWRADGLPQPLPGAPATVDGGTVYVAAPGADGQPTVFAVALADGAVRDLRLGIDGPVEALAVDGGKLLVAGQFTRIGSQASQPTRLGIAEVNPADGVASGWDAGLVAAPVGGPVTVTSLVVDGATVRLSGSFGRVGGAERCGVAAVARADAAATAWDPRTWNDRGSCAVDAQLALSGDRVWIASEWLRAANVSARRGLAAIDVAGDRLLPWAPVVGASGAATDEPSPKDLEVSHDGATVYLAATGMTELNGVPRSRVAALASAAGGAVADQPGAVRDWDPAPTGAVNAIELSDDDATAYLGGGFSAVGGQPRSRLASVATSGSGAASDWAPNPDGTVNQLARGGDGALYVAGGFRNLGGQPRNGLAAFAGGSGAPTAFDPQAPAASYNDIAVAGDVVYVALGGAERAIGGQTRRAVAALRASDGQAAPWAPVVPAGAVNQVSTVGGAVYLLGTFDEVGSTGGAPQPRSRIAAVAADGALLPWAPAVGTSPSTAVRPRVVAAGSRLAIPVTGPTGLGGVGQYGFAVFGEAVSPVLTSGPAVVGSPRLDAAVTCAPGRYAAGEPLRRSYRWLRDGQPIGGATASEHTVAADDVGTMLACEETATNPAGSLTTASEAVRAVSGPPANEEPPQVIGTVAVGQTATCTTGRWTNADAYGYRWLLDGSPIAGAVGRTYAPADGQEGRGLSCEVTARNGAGPGPAAVSAARAIAARPGPPVTTTGPTTTTSPTTTTATTTPPPTTTTPTPGPTPKPLAVRLGTLAAKRTLLTVAVRAGGAGRLTLVLTTKVGKRTLTLASGYVAVKRAGALSVRLKPSRKGRGALRKGKRLTIAVRATLTPKDAARAAVGRATATRKVKVR